jgi:hypothetical protein
MKFARCVFLIAGIYGLIVVTPLYFTEAKTGRDYPPPITHPEYYYGFVGITIAWQIAFLIISRDPLRYRPLIIPSVLEKITFGVAVVLLFLQHRTSSLILGFAAVDLILAVAFTLVYLRTAPKVVARRDAS